MCVPCNGVLPAYAMPGMPRGQAAPFGRDGRLGQPGHDAVCVLAQGSPAARPGLGHDPRIARLGSGEGGHPGPSRQASRPWAPRPTSWSQPLASQEGGGLTWGRRRGAGETKGRRLYWAPALEGDPWA